MSLKNSYTTSDYLQWDSATTLVRKLYKDKNYRISLLIGCGIFFGLRISDLLRLTWNMLLNSEAKFVLIESILMAEDQRFFSHKGFDSIELAKMKGEHDKEGKPIRGCSTISQQVAKNCFTFCSRTWARKVFEAYYTVLIETFWGKERILEVYMNVAETGRGLFGVESACHHYYGCSSGDVSLDEAAALACVLPKPLAITPSIVYTVHASKHRKIVREVGRRI